MAAILIYRIAYGIFPVLRYFLVYVFYPPGPLPIDPYGPIWFFAMAMILSIGVSWSYWLRTGDVLRFRRSLTLQLLALSTLSCYFGRSHDNSVLILMPFLGLVLLDSFSNAAGALSRYTLALLLASILAWIPVFGWSAWIEAWHTGQLTDFNFAATRERLSYGNSPAVIDSAVGSANCHNFAQQLQQAVKLMDMVAKRGEPFVVLDSLLVLQPHYANNAWSAANGPANFLYIPPVTIRREFLTNTAQRIGRSGWVIVQRDCKLVEPLVADYAAVYQRTDKIDLGAYSAIRFALPSAVKFIPQHESFK